MEVFFHEFYQLAVKFIFLGAVAFGGVMGGIRFRKYKDAKAAAEGKKDSEN